VDLSEVRNIFSAHPKIPLILDSGRIPFAKTFLKGLAGSSLSFIVAEIANKLPALHVLIVPDKEEAAYLLNDMESLLEEGQVLFFPASYRQPYQVEETANANILLRAEVLDKINRFTPGKNRSLCIVTYPTALSEKVVTRQVLSKNTLSFRQGEKLSADFMNSVFAEHGFERVDYVVEPGHYSIRGGIVDVWSFSSDLPYRIEFFGDEVESIRLFEPVTQLSRSTLTEASIVPNVSERILLENRESFFDYINRDPVLWIKDVEVCAGKIEKEYLLAEKLFIGTESLLKQLSPEKLYMKKAEFLQEIGEFTLFETGLSPYHAERNNINFDQKPQRSFSKNFDLFHDELEKNITTKKKNIIFSDSAKQIERLYAIFDDLVARRKKIPPPGKDHLGELSAHLFSPILLPIHEGFTDPELGRVFYTDHQVFERYQRFRIRNSSYKKNEALTLKEIKGLSPGDYVVHIDHGIGRFGGLEKITVDGKEQETIRILYKDHDVLNISIHALHRISKYAGKEGAVPKLDKLGSQAWTNLKNKTKKKVKEIAFDLIQLYAKRKAEQGFAFAPDNYLQNELEASFIYEDTPDQEKSTQDVKKDMEAEWPMDRLVCGDVGFGKTEIAIRAAFKAVNDGKQVAILVPTTILALQHFKTFSDRLEEFKLGIDYLNRFRSAKDQKEILLRLNEGKTDIIIGTHKLVGKNVKFKDLGLLIIDEEQKFGVAVKDKLKTIKQNVDTLTLTATPIPRTLQFSMMGARDLSIINTPPPNRYPVQTEIHLFNEEIIRDAIIYEKERGGQVFFVHNRIGNLKELAGMLQRLCPDIRIAIGHGQMEGEKLEKVMLDFIEGQSDVLLSTTIIENGLDIPNANTIIINDAHMFGLSDLHQMRGRVGRSNKKAFAYLLCPPFSTLTEEARKRLKAIEQFSELGSGFNIAMRDLDIRGAGNLLGAEQSGFISDIGYETYMKILEEAIAELKNSGDRIADNGIIRTDVLPISDIRYPIFVRDCQLDTDLELLIPDSYVNNISERIYLYKELDNCGNDEQLESFRKMLRDRFGEIPIQTEELIKAVRLRRKGQEAGFEKLFLKNGKMTGYFVSKQDSAYYSSDTFKRILEHVRTDMKTARMKEGPGRLTLTFEPIRTVEAGIATMTKLLS